VAAHLEPYAASTERWKVLLLHSTLSAEQQVSPRTQAQGLGLGWGGRARRG